MLFHPSIKQRIYGVVGFCICGLVGFAAAQISYLNSSLRAERQQELNHLAQVALSIARNAYDLAEREHMPDQLARQKAAERIGKLRYGNGDYFWISDLASRMVMHPIRPELNGQDVADITDMSGKHPFAEIAEVVKRQGAGFVEYQWPNAGNEAAQPRLSYVVGFEPWGWVIGTGVYFGDLEAQVWSNLKIAVAGALVLLSLLSATMLIIARTISSALVSMTSSLAKLGDGDFDVSLPGLDRADELGAMARSIEQFKLKEAEKARKEIVIEQQRRAVAERVKADALKKMAETVEYETQVAVSAVAGGAEQMARSARLMSESAQTVQRSSGSCREGAGERPDRCRGVHSNGERVRRHCLPIQFVACADVEGGYSLERRAIDHFQALGDCNQGGHRHSSDQ